MTLFTIAVPAAAEEPLRPALRESVTVELVQLDVTVWPKKPGSQACRGLTAQDFELRVDGKPHPIEAVDALGAGAELYLPDLPEAARFAAGGGMSYVLLFDLWHLDLFFHGFAACPRTKPLAFEEARRFAREELRTGDRLLLVTFGGWPVVHYDWIRTPAEAVAALDHLEKNRQVMAPRQTHFHHDEWIAGMESLFLALGKYPGRKDVFYLADDFRFDDVAMRMTEIAGRAQSNGVVVNAIDLLSTCRKIPGPPRCDPYGGLGCTPFRDPIAIRDFSGPTGGRLFRTDRIASAANDLRSMRDCRYVVSFQHETGDRKRSPWVRLELRGHKDLTLLAPESFEPAGRAPERREKTEALFLLPRFGRGIAAEAGLWPYRPTGKRGRWKAFVVVRVERTDDEPWTDELTSLDLHVIVRRGSRLYVQHHKTLEGEDLAALRAHSREKLLFFPVDAVRPGTATVDVTVTGNVEDVFANFRKSFEVPKPPGAGEARPWFLSDQVARFGELSLPVPSLDDVVNAGDAVSFLGFGCRGEAGADESHVGRLVPFNGGDAVTVPVTWLDAPDPRRHGCGWLLGRAAGEMGPGLWTFEPPANLGPAGAAPVVEFSVTAPEGEATLPEEVRSP